MSAPGTASVNCMLLVISTKTISHLQGWVNRMWGGCGGEVHDLCLQLDFPSSEDWWLLALLQKLIGGLKGTQPAEMSPATSSSLTFLALLHFPYFSFSLSSTLFPFSFLLSVLLHAVFLSHLLSPSLEPWGFPFWILSCRFGCDPKAYTTKTNWPQSAYPSCRQAEETLVRLCNIMQLAIHTCNLTNVSSACVQMFRLSVIWYDLGS